MMGSVLDSGASISNTVLSCPERVYDTEAQLNDQRNEGVCVCVQAKPLVRVPHLTPVVQRADVMCVLVRHLLAVAASEAQRVLVAVGGGVQPGGRVQAVVGEGLLGGRAQKLQEVQLDDVRWDAVRPGVGELEGNTGITVTPPPS